jgi:hypothetical protein
MIQARGDAGMTGINHLVLVGHELAQMRESYERLGFTLTPEAEHPFGTSNTVIQLHGGYLELLAVTRREVIPEHTSERFSFGAFNADYLKRHEGFSMLVVESQDAHGDSARWQAAGLRAYAPFGFSRRAALADGDEIEISFTLANVSHEFAPWLGLFATQHHNPEYFAQAAYLTHANTAKAIADAWIVGEATADLVDYLATAIGAPGRRETLGRLAFEIGAGRIVLADVATFERAFGVAPPHREDGPHWVGYSIACESLDYFAKLDLPRVAGGFVVPPHEGFGTAIRFMASGDAER